MKKKILLTLFPCLLLLLGSSITTLNSRAAEIGAAGTPDTGISQKGSATARDIFDTNTVGGFFSPALNITENPIPSADIPAETSDDLENEYSTFAIADVNNYVNVRSLPSTDGEILGKMYDGSVAEILATEGSGDEMWFKVISGAVEGYIKAQYFIYGEDAEAVIDDYVTRYAQVQASRHPTSNTRGSCCR